MLAAMAMPMVFVGFERGVLGSGDAAAVERRAQEDGKADEQQDAAHQETGLERVECDEVAQREVRRRADFIFEQDALFLLRVEAQERLVENGLQQARLARGDGEARADEDAVL